LGGEKMKVAGIVAEYNPFHRGHAYQIAQTKAQGATHIVVCMSGNFVQRGDFAVADKWVRTRAALKCGADLVIELPIYGCLSSGAVFAQYGVDALHSLGIVNCLSFGSECGDLNKLKSASDAVIKVLSEGLMDKFSEQGYSFPRALAAAAKKICDDADVLSNPNDTLAVSYINALKGTNISPMVIKREGAPHDSNEHSGEYASASKIRELLKSGEDASQFMPDLAARIIADAVHKKTAPAGAENVDRVILSKLRELTSEDFAEIEDVAEGLENRIYEAVRSAENLNELYMLIKSKRYTHARIRRIILRAALGIKGKNPPPEYIRILGIGKRGAELLNKAIPSLPIVSRLADVKKLSAAGQDQFSLLCKTTDFYMLSQPKAGRCDMEMTMGICKE
jgi:predicted nucleotidyltransferase